MVEVEPIGKYLHADELAKENLKLFKHGEGEGSNVTACNILVNNATKVREG